MVKPLSDYNLIARFDVPASAWVLASGVTGTWVNIDGSGNAAKPSADSFSFMVWNESGRNKLPGTFTPDVAATGNITLMLGKFRFVTSEFSGTPAIGQKLYVDATGKLSTTGTNFAVAVCTKAPYTDYYVNRQYSVIEAVTL